MELAVKRCPANPEFAGQCSFGYEGPMCDGCIEGYGMSPSRECKPCGGTGYTTQSLLLLAVIIVAIAVGFYIMARFWIAFPLKHFARCAFQPGRILITYSQVTSQLGDVLDFQYPGVFGGA